MIYSPVTGWKQETTSKLEIAYCVGCFLFWGYMAITFGRIVYYLIGLVA